MLSQNLCGETAQSSGWKSKTGKGGVTPCFLFSYGDILPRKTHLCGVNEAFRRGFYVYFYSSLCSHIARLQIPDSSNMVKTNKKLKKVKSPVHPHISLSASSIILPGRFMNSPVSQEKFSIKNCFVLVLCVSSSQSTSHYYSTHILREREREKERKRERPKVKGLVIGIHCINCIRKYVCVGVCLRLCH